MTVLGGVIVYGVDEQSGVATAVTPVLLEGQRERIQQIVRDVGAKGSWRALKRLGT